jgi:prophage antirepressor-like protein
MNESMTKVTAVTTFNFGDIMVRTTGTPESPLFCAVDVCRALGITNSRDACATLREDQKGVATTDTLGGAQQIQYVTESGLYALIFKSRKPEAERFQAWVTDEVLPSIRKTGGYIAQPMSAARAALAQAQALVELEERQLAQETRLARLESQVPSPDGFDWMPVCAYASETGIKLTQGEDAAIGRRASALSRERGVEIRKVRVPNSVYAHVNSYHLNILRDVFGT